MSKISENGLFGQKKAPAGWFHSKTKVVNTFPTIPDPIRTKLYLKITIFITILLKKLRFSSNSIQTHRFLDIIWVGNIPEYVYNHCFAVGAPRRGFFLAKKPISRNFGHGHFSKKSVLVKNSIFGSLI